MAGLQLGDMNPEVDARRALVGPGEVLLLGALDRQVVGAQRGAPGTVRPLDNAADEPGAELVARPHKARQRRRRHYRLTNPQLAGAEAEAIRSAHRLGAYFVNRERIGQL